MLTRTNIIIQLRQTICLALLLGLVAATIPKHVAAQGQPNFLIEVTTTGNNTCFYEIQRPNGTRWSEQDTLRVGTNNIVRFKATGVDAAIEVSKNNAAVYPRQGNTRGFIGRRRNNSFDLGRGRNKPVSVRNKSENGNSLHKIEISCEFTVEGADIEVESSTKSSGPNIGAFESVLLIPAMPLPAPGLTIPGPKWLEIKIPDLDLDKPRQGPWREAGGPEMEVEDP